MNFKHIKALIAFSLVATVAQPMQAATYTDYAKKAGRCTWHLAEIVGGALLLNGLTKHLVFAYRVKQLNRDLEYKLIRSLAVCMLLTDGYNGLKKEWTTKL